MVYEDILDIVEARVLYVRCPYVTGSPMCAPVGGYFFYIDVPCYTLEQHGLCAQAQQCWGKNASSTSEVRYIPGKNK